MINGVMPLQTLKMLALVLLINTAKYGKIPFWTRKGKRKFPESVVHKQDRVVRLHQGGGVRINTESVAQRFDCRKTVTS